MNRSYIINSCTCTCISLYITERLAESVHDTAGVYFVPAFSGLYAPHWQSDARGLVGVAFMIRPLPF